MAYNVSAGDILEATIVGSSAGQTTLSVLHYRLAVITPQDGVTLANLINADLNSALPSCLIAAYADCCADNFSINSLILQWIYPVRYARLVYSAVITDGTVANGSFPPAVASALTKRSDMAGRSKQGTLHMPGVPNDFVINGLLTAGAISFYNQLGAIVRDVVNVPGGGGSDLFPIIYHRQSPAASADITSVSVQSTSRTMRRRVVGRGI